MFSLSARQLTTSITQGAPYTEGTPACPVVLAAGYITNGVTTQASRTVTTIVNANMADSFLTMVTMLQKNKAPPHSGDA